jgi:hypothetical protein
MRAEEIDPYLLIRDLERRISKLTSPRARTMAELWLEHIRAEYPKLELDGVMKTMVPEPEFVVTASDIPTGSATIRGYNAVKAMYEQEAANGWPWKQLEIGVFAAWDDGLAYDGLVTKLVPGAKLVAQGIEVDDPSADYIETYHLANLIPYSGDLLLGEHIFRGDVITREKAEPSF